MLAGKNQRSRFVVATNNRSRRLDAAVVEALESRQLLSGTLNFATHSDHAVGGGPDSVIVADVNGDGAKDIVTANYNGTLSVLLGTGNGTFLPAITTPDGLNAGIASVSFSLSFLIADNKSTGQVSILASNGDGTFQTPNVLTLGGPVSAVTVADVTGDGKADLLVGYYNGTVGVLPGNGSGVFANAPASTFTVAGNAANNHVTSLIVGDFYSSTVPDIIAGDANGTVSLFKGNVSNGSTSFNGTFNSNATTVLTGGASPFLNVSSGDVNGDGKPDLVTTGYDGTVNVLLSNGSAFLAAQPLVTAPGAVGTTVSDFNGDGVVDLGFVNYYTGEVSVAMGNNDGTFSSVAEDFNVGGQPDGVQFADFNGDGRMDIVTANYGADSVSVLLNTSSIAPKITNTNNPTFTTGVAGSFLVTSIGFPAGTVKTSALPAGLTLKNLGNGNAMIVGTPGAATGGTYTLTMSASNAAGMGATKTFTLTIDQPRKFTSATSATFISGVNKTFTITTSGFPVVAITDGGVVNPAAGLTFTSNGNGTATITGTATAAPGAYQIMLRSGNGIGGGPAQLFTLIVDAAPVFTSAASATFTVGTAVTFPITTTGFPFAALTEVGVLPAGIKFVPGTNGTGKLVGTPLAKSGKVYTLTLSAKNTIATVPATTTTVHQTFTLTVDEAPTFITTTAHATFVHGKPGTFAFSTTGFPLAAITESGGTGLPAGFTLLDNGNDTADIEGTAASAGSFTFTISAMNGIGTATEVFTLLIS